MVSRELRTAGTTELDFKLQNIYAKLVSKGCFIRVYRGERNWERRIQRHRSKILQIRFCKNGSHSRGSRSKGWSSMSRCKRVEERRRAGRRKKEGMMLKSRKKGRKGLLLARKMLRWRKMLRRLVRGSKRIRRKRKREIIHMEVEVVVERGSISSKRSSSKSTNLTLIR